jgi:hypothetical protein
MPPKGSQKLAVLLCKFRDSVNVESQSEDFFKDLFISRGSGGLNDYWSDASLGSINLDGTEVFNWRTIDQNRDDYISDRPDRASKIQGAVDAHGVDRSNYAGIVALFNVDPGDSGAAGGVLGGPNNDNVTFLAHETGHLFGLSHSYDQSTRKTNTWSAPGEYWDRHDIMSAMNVHSHIHARFGQRGPLLCTANLDYMEWLPSSRVWREPITSSFSECIDLVPLGHPEIPGYLAAKIAGYHIEFRTRDRWDAGIPRATVLIHSMFGGNAVVMASDKANWVNDWQAGQSFGPSQAQVTISGGVRISIADIDLSRGKARVCITRTAQKMEGVLFLGAIAVGDGWVLLKDVLFRVPPKGGPLRELLESAVHLSPRAAIEEHLGRGLSDELETIHRLLAAVEQRGRG